MRQRAERRLLTAVIVSLLLHGLILSIKLGVPGFGQSGVSTPDLSVRIMQPPPPVALSPTLPTPDFEAMVPLPPQDGFVANITQAKTAKKVTPNNPPTRVAPAKRPAPKVQPATPPKLADEASNVLAQPDILALEESLLDTFTVPKPSEGETNGSPEAAPDTPKPTVEVIDDNARAAAKAIAEAKAEQVREAERLAREAEESLRAQEEILRQLAAADEARKAAEDEKLRLAAEAAALKKVEEARLKAKVEAEQAAIAEMARQLQIERERSEAERLAQEDARIAREQEAKRAATEAEVRKLAAEEEARRQALEAEAKRLAIEAETRRQAQEEAARRAAVAEAQRQAEQRQIAAAAARAEQQRLLREQAEAAQARQRAQQAAEAEARRQAAEAEARRQALAEEARRREEQARVEAQQQAKLRAAEAQRLAEQRAAEQRAAEARAAAEARRQAALREEAARQAAAAAATAAEQGRARALAEGNATAGGGRAGGQSQGQTNAASGGSGMGKNETAPAPGITRDIGTSQAGRSGPKFDIPSDPRRLTISGMYMRDLAPMIYAATVQHKLEREAPFALLKAAKGRGAYQNPTVTVALRSDGSIISVTINQSSGNPELDATIRKVVEMVGPYYEFPPDLAYDYDEIEITKVWSINNVLQLMWGGE